MSPKFERLAAGDDVGPFRLIEPLGDPAGRRERSFRAVRREDHRQVALTIYHPGDVMDRRYVDEIRENAARYERLGPCDGLLPDVGEGGEGKLFWVYSAFIPGARTLKEFHVEGWLWTNRELQAIGIRLGRALAHAEKKRRVIFGGFGMNDVLFNPSKCDAWLAKVPCRRAAPRSPATWARLLRDVTCQPPELLKGERPSPGTDRYALCALLFTLAAGRPPYGAGPDVADGLSAVLNDAPPSLEDTLPISDGLRRVVMRGLQRDPSQRFQDAESMVEALAECGVDDRFVSDSKRLRDVAICHFPLPAASPLALLPQRIDRSHEILAIQAAASGLLTVIAVLGLGELARHGLPPGNELSRPSLGDWLNVARRASRRLEGKELVFPEWKALFGDRDNAPGTGDALLSNLINWRNRQNKRHGVHDAAIRKSLLEGRKRLDAVLGPLAFLSRLRFVWPGSVRVGRGDRLSTIPRYTVTGHVLRGVGMRGFEETLDMVVDQGVVLAASSDFRRVLPLDPWVRVFECPVCGEIDAWVWLHAADGGGAYRSFHGGQAHHACPECSTATWHSPAPEQHDGVVPDGGGPCPICTPGVI